MNVIKAAFVIIMNFMSRLLGQVMKFNPKNIMSMSTSQCNLQSIREELVKFEGGSVDLEMDEDTGIAVLTLNNPKKLNSMTGRMMVELAEQIDLLESWKIGKGVIIMGANGNFCSGGDLTFVRRALHYGSEMAAFQHDTLTRLFNLPLLSVALIQGHTLGGGAELSTACDFRVMSSSAKIGFVQLKMGLTTGWGATTRLVHLLGRQKTLSLLSSGKVMTSTEAEKVGLVDHMVSSSLPEEELGECKRWLVSNFCRHEADLLQANKSLIVYCDLNRDLETSLRHERQVFANHWGGPKQKAALEANIKHK